MNAYESETPRFAIAVAAFALSALTIGTMVVAPAHFDEGFAPTDTVLAARPTDARPVEVAIVPASDRGRRHARAGRRRRAGTCAPRTRGRRTSRGRWAARRSPTASRTSDPARHARGAAPCRGRARRRALLDERERDRDVVRLRPRAASTRAAGSAPPSSAAARASRRSASCAAPSISCSSTARSSLDRLLRVQVGHRLVARDEAPRARRCGAGPARRGLPDSCRRSARTSSPRQASG